MAGQDGRLAPAYFSQDYKKFDQHLPTVKNETTVYNLVYESCLQTSIPPLISIFYAREGTTIFRSKFFCLTVAKKFVGEPFRLSLISGIEKIYASEGYVTIFGENFLSHSTETFRRGTLLCCVSESFR